MARTSEFDNGNSDKKLQHKPQSFEDARSCAKPKNIRVPKQYQFLLTIHLGKKNVSYPYLRSFSLNC